MLYDVEQVAIKLNVSKVTIYNKLKLKEFKDKILIKQGKTYIDDDLINLIKDNLKLTTKLNDDYTEPMEEPQNTINDEDIVNINKELISALLEQLNVKDIQIQELNNRLAAEQELTKNRQVLELKRQPQDIKALEEHFKTIDNSLLEVRERMLQRKNESSKSIFQKIFKK